MEEALDMLVVLEELAELEDNRAEALQWVHKQEQAWVQSLE